MGASDRKYNLAAELVVKFPIGHDYDTKLLARQVRLMDQISPWASCYNNSEPGPSINWMSEITMREGDGIDRFYFVEIRPPFLHTFDQAHAYEQYANTLARNLAQNLPSGAIGVCARLIINGVSGDTYRPPKN